MTTTTTKRAAVSRLSERTAPPWTWSALGAAALLLATVALSNGSAWGTLTQVLSLAPFLVLVGLGQMLVITLGPGNIDVSVGAVIGLGAYTSVIASSSTGSGLVALLAGAGAGVAVAALSCVGILVLRIPPIIATLALSLLAGSVTLVLADGLTASPDAGLRSLVNLRLAGVPVMAMVLVVVALAVDWALRNTLYGRGLLAVGQNPRAAGKAGIPVSRITASTYLLSGAAAGVTGALLAAFISTSPDLGTSYLLDSVAVVVLGGTLISGGRAVPWGVWGGALFLILLSGLLNLVGWSIGAQNILKGIVVVVVVAISAGPLIKRRAARRGPRR